MLTEKSMLTTPVRPTTLSRTESFENPPCPPYNLSQEDVLAQTPIAEEEDLWTEMDRIQDPRVLKEKFYAEHQLMRDQLNLAGQFGLELQQSLEQAQYAERQTYAQIQALQDENIALQSRIQHTQALSHHLTGSEDEVRNLTSENESLQKELDGCRRELKTFRKELDNLVEQMADMGTEVLDAKNKVSVYSRRLNEVEQELSTTQELNINLQEQLHMTLEKQKQAQTTTALAVKKMESELGRVVSDSGSIRSTLEELESRQEKCEGKVVEMFSNTKEYAQLLEEAQSTIQTMRIESDMDGRGWGGHSPTGWNPQTKRSSNQLSTLAMEDPELKARDISTELDSWDNDQTATSGMSLGMELGLEIVQNDSEWDNTQKQQINEQTQENIFSSPPSTPVSTQPSESSKQLTPEPSPDKILMEKHHKETQTPPLPALSQQQRQPTPPIPKEAKRIASASLSADLQQRLEEHNILQTTYSSSSVSSRPPWNPSVALEGVPVTAARNSRSRSASRGPTSASSRSSSRSMSQASLYNMVSPITPSTFRRPTLPTSQTTASTISSQDFASMNSGRRQGSTSSKSERRPRSQTTANTVEKNPTAGLKYLLSPDNSANEMANVITKTKTSGPSKAGSASSITSKASTKITGENSSNRPKKRIVSSTSSNSLTSNSAKVDASNKKSKEVPKISTSQTSPSSPAQSIKKKGSAASLSASPGALTATSAGTGRTTPRSHPMSPSPRAISRASMSSSPSSPAPVSPSIASKKLRALSGSGSVAIQGGAGSRRSSVTSPLPLPLPLPTEGTSEDTPVANSEEPNQ